MGRAALRWLFSDAKHLLRQNSKKTAGFFAQKLLQVRLRLHLLDVITVFIRSAVVWEEITAPKIRENVYVKMSLSYQRKMTLPFSKDHLGGFLLKLSIEKQGKEDWKYYVRIYCSLYCDLCVSRTRISRFSVLIPGGGGGYSQKNWVGVCGPLPKTLTLFMTKICDFSYSIYDLTKNLVPFL